MGETTEKNKVEHASNRKTRQTKNAEATAVAATKPATNSGEPGCSAAEKGLKRKDGMGLIFMCNAKTKMDCFQYNVLGMPASKKELVVKIYRGMRLFLFDTDLKLMYGIFRASGPGGYAIEPKAFQSAFPSQVRFNVFIDCLPLPEEIFKAAISSNYYENKFDCQLSSEQVKNLCRLFIKTTKCSALMQLDGGSRAAFSPITNWNRKRTLPGVDQLDDSIRVLSSRSDDHSRMRNHFLVDHSEQLAERRYASVDWSEHLNRSSAPFAREVCRPPSLQPNQQLPQLPSLLYANGSQVDDHNYRRVPLPHLPPRPSAPSGYQIANLDVWPDVPVGYCDNYNLHRERIPYQGAIHPAGLLPTYFPPPFSYRH